MDLQLCPQPVAAHCAPLVLNERPSSRPGHLGDPGGFLVIAAFLVRATLWSSCEHVFGARICAGMLKSHEIESLRRSQAMAPLSVSHVNQLLDSCADMARERAAIVEILSSLPDSFGEVRKALNELAADRVVVGPANDTLPRERWRPEISRTDQSPVGCARSLSLAVVASAGCVISVMPRELTSDARHPGPPDQRDGADDSLSLSVARAERPDFYRTSTALGRRRHHTSARIPG
jgi:hypothetical protein